MSTQERQGIVEKPGMYLGMREEENFELHVMPISAGDAFYFMTDGLTDRIGRRMDLPLHNYLEMVSFVQALTVGPDQRDDATAICIFIRAIPNLLLRRQGWPRVLLFNGYGDYRRFKGQVSKLSRRQQVVRIRCRRLPSMKRWPMHWNAGMEIPVNIMPD